MPRCARPQEPCGGGDIPPLYAVTVAVPTTRMTVIAFGVAVLVGRTVLFLAIAFGVSALIH